MWKSISLLALSCFLFPSLVLGQVVSSYSLGDGLTIAAADSSFSTTINGRFQTRFESEVPLTSNFDLGNVESGMSVRRARLITKGHIYDKAIGYRMELGFSNYDIRTVDYRTGSNANPVLDAYVTWRFWRNAEVWFGQAMLPGNHERTIYSSDLQFVARSLGNYYFNLDRDLGIQFRNHHQLGKMVVREYIALTQGEGRNIFTGNEGGYQYTGRLELLPLGDFKNQGRLYVSDLEREEEPKLMIGLVYNFNDNAVRQRGSLGQFETTERDLQTLMADLLFKYKGVSVLGEFFNRTAPEPVYYSRNAPIQQGAFYTGMGINAQVGYLLNSNWEFAGRFTYVEPQAETGRNIIRQYTLGINKFVANHNLKVQADASYSLEDGLDPTMQARLQVEVGF